MARPRKNPLPEIGDQFERLTVIARPFRRRAWYVSCRCDCGATVIVQCDHLFRGHTGSCGCYQIERTGASNRKHGESTSRLHYIWSAMKSRCSNPNVERFENYGKRGISVCDAWQDFIPFRDWAIANGYQEGLQIDRIDNDGNYEPSNCRWVSREQQARNKRNNRIATAFNETKLLKEWVKDPRCRVSYKRLHARLTTFKWDAERAITTPPMKTNSAKITGSWPRYR